MHLGIDFGTTRTVVAVCDRGNYPLVSFSCGNGDAQEWYPSLVAERNGDLVFGWKAFHCVGDPSWNVVRSFKRLLSEESTRPDQVVLIGSTKRSITALVSEFLSALRADLLENSNLSQLLQHTSDLQTVIATPANAHSNQRFITLDAFQRAGFAVTAMLNEPSAAGFAYAHRYGRTLTSRREHLIVYDLGGGTFDASLVRMTGGHHDALFTAGIAKLGGDDFDRVLVELVMESLEGTVLTDKQMLSLLDQCREVKEALHPNSRRVLIDLHACLGPEFAKREFILPVETYYKACEPLIERTIDVMARVAMADDSTPDESSDLAGVAGIFVVGGASALPAVGRALRAKFGRRVHRSLYPSGACAIGLAVAADKVAGFQLTEKFSRTFGVFREQADGAAVCCDSIFDKSTILPAAGAPKVMVERTYRAVHNVGHFRYVECDAIDESGVPQGDMTPSGEVLFPFDASLRALDLSRSDLLVRRMEALGPLIGEYYSVDDKGIVEVKIVNLDDGYERQYRLWEQNAEVS